MARQFVAASNQSITYTGTVGTLISDAVGTFAVWHKPTGTPGSSNAAYSLPALLNDVGGYLGIHRGSLSGSDKIWAYNWDGSEDSVGFTYTNDVWVHAIWRHGSGNLDVFKNGLIAGTLASGNTSNITNTLRLGLSPALNGDLAEHAIWNVALDDAECAALGQGFSPLLVRPTSLTRYCPLIGRASVEPDLIEAAVATHNNNPLVADHPRMIYPSAARVLKWTAGVSGFQPAWAANANVLLGSGA